MHSAAFDPIPLIGLPYERGGNGPRVFDCWGLYRHVAREAFGIDVPVITPAESLLGRTKQHVRERSKACWQAVSDPGAGDLVVLLGQAGREYHVGIWLDLDGGGVLHASEGAGVAFHRAAGLVAAGWRVVEVVRYRRAP